jgi:hypothetical protein
VEPLGGAVVPPVGDAVADGAPPVPVGGAPDVVGAPVVVGRLAEVGTVPVVVGAAVVRAGLEAPGVPVPVGAAVALGAADVVGPAAVVGAAGEGRLDDGAPEVGAPDDGVLELLGRLPPEPPEPPEPVGAGVAPGEPVGVAVELVGAETEGPVDVVGDAVTAPTVSGAAEARPSGAPSCSSCTVST